MMCVVRLLDWSPGFSRLKPGLQRKSVERLLPVRRLADGDRSLNAAADTEELTAAGYHQKSKEIELSIDRFSTSSCTAETQWLTRIATVQ